MDDDRSETVGAAIEGAAITTTDQARQDAAPVSTYPTHALGSRGRSNDALDLRPRRLVDLLRRLCRESTAVLYRPERDISMRRRRIH